MAKKPMVSVIVSVLNRMHTIDKCTEALLKQDYGNYEVIIVDGGSKDGTLEYLRKTAKKNKKLRVFVDLRPSRQFARNLAIEKSRGKFFIFTDSDCVPEKSWINELMKPFKDKSVGGVIGTTVADKSGLFWYKMENNYLQFIGHNDAFRREVIEGVGGFDLKFRIAKEDSDLCFRILEKGWKIVHQPSARLIHISRRVSVFYRIRNQRTFIFDGLLHKRHPALYRKYMTYKDIVLTGFTTLIFLAAIASIFYFPIFTIGVVSIYILSAFYKLLTDSDGNLKESVAFLAFAWLIPILRFANFVRGFIIFRSEK